MKIRSQFERDVFLDPAFVDRVRRGSINNLVRLVRVFRLEGSRALASRAGVHSNTVVRIERNEPRHGVTVKSLLAVLEELELRVKVETQAGIVLWTSDKQGYDG